ncbi:glycosyltransferase family 4 protein [Candidatus Sumerlaeota bacterium]|nr:glycosyltransferase family 4 protein [Candidatus Sumerlaeota bacterium]
MRILFTIGSLREGGAEGQLLQLMRGLRGRGHEVALMLLRYEGARLQGALDDGFHIFDAGIPKFGTIVNLSAWLEMREVRSRSEAFLARFAPDVVHAHLFWAHYWAAQVLPRHSQVPFITSRLQTWRADTKPRLERIMEDRVNKRVDCVIANAQTVADSCLGNERHLEGKIEVIHNGIDLAAVDAQGSTSWSDTKEIGIINVANCHPLKGHDDLKSAVKVVNEFHKGVEVCLVGSGTDAPGLGAPAIHQAGAQPSVIPFIKGADIAVQASRDEGMSVALLEYMACGKAVVATDVGGTREAVQHGINGLLCRPGDPKDLAEKIRMLITDKELRHRLGLNARRTIEEKFSDATHVERHAGVYRKLVGRKRPQA